MDFFVLIISGFSGMFFLVFQEENLTPEGERSFGETSATRSSFYLYNWVYYLIYTGKIIVFIYFAT